MKYYFICSLFLLTGFLIEAYASSYCRQQDDGCQPYTVTGRACLEGEHCEELTSGSYKGYHLKSNIPLDDERQSRIRPNMFTQAVLKDEIGKCIAQADINPPTPAECNLSNIETRQPFRLIGIRCDSKSVYCSYHTSGPYKGLLEKSNIMPSDARFAGLNLKVPSGIQKKCIRDGQSICTVRSGDQFNQIALNCNSSARYCRKITSGRYAGLIRRSSHIAPEEWTEIKPTWIAIPKVLKCRPQLAYMAKKLALGGPPSSVANIENNKVLSSLLNAGDPDLIGQSGAGGGGNDPVLPSAEDWPDLNLEQGDSGALQRLKNFFVGLVRMLLGGGNTNSQQTTVAGAGGNTNPQQAPAVQSRNPTVPNPDRGGFSTVPSSAQTGCAQELAINGRAALDPALFESRAWNFEQFKRLKTPFFIGCGSLTNLGKQDLMNLHRLKKPNSGKTQCEQLTCQEIRDSAIYGPEYHYRKNPITKEQCNVLHGGSYEFGACFFSPGIVRKLSVLFKYARVTQVKNCTDLPHLSWYDRQVCKKMSTKEKCLWRSNMWYNNKCYGEASYKIHNVR